jgi:hypothetical protein
MKMFSSLCGRKLPWLKPTGLYGQGHRAMRVLGLCLWGLAQTGVAEDDGRLALAQKAMTLSGMRGAVEAMPAQIETALGRWAAATAAYRRALPAILRETLDPRAMASSVERELAEALTRKELEKAVGWLESDAGRRIVAAEKAFDVGKSAQAPSVIAAERKKKLVKINALRRDSDFMAMVANHAAEATLQAMLTRSSGAPGRSEKELRASSAAGQARVRDLLREQAPDFLAATYAGVGDTDLDELITFLSSKEGRHYTEALFRILDGALGGAMKELARRMARVGEGDAGAGR